MPRATKRKHAQQQRMLLALDKKKRRKSTEPEEALLGEGSNGEESAVGDLSGEVIYLVYIFS